MHVRRPAALVHVPQKHANVKNIHSSIPSGPPAGNPRPMQAVDGGAVVDAGDGEPCRGVPRLAAEEDAG